MHGNAMVVIDHSFVGHGEAIFNQNGRATDSQISKVEQFGRPLSSRPRFRPLGRTEPLAPAIATNHYVHYSDLLKEVRSKH